MKNSYILLILTLAVVLSVSGCDSEGEKVPTSNPYRGGTDSVSISFSANDPPSEVFADTPFMISLDVENTGEYDIPQGQFKVGIQGINPETYGLTESQKTANMELTGTVYDVDRNEIPGTQDYMEFGPLQYQEPLQALLADVSIQAIACYSYGTKARSDICIKRDVLRDEPGDVCTVREDKTVYSSSAPVQVTSFRQTPQGAGKIGFSFQVINEGVGDVYAPNTDATCEDDKNNVHVTVSGPAGIECPALGGTTSGTIRLDETTGRLVTCTLDVSSTTSDYREPISIEVEYNHKQVISRSIDVRPVN